MLRWLRWSGLVVGIVAVSAPGQARADDHAGLWCSFTEPFISVFSGSGRVVYQNAGVDEAVAKASFQGAGDHGALFITLANVETVQLDFKAGPGGDGMSDMTFPLVGTLHAASQVAGGCVRLPDGAGLAKIVGVAPDDMLTLRAGPSARARALDKIRLSHVWLLPGRARGNWRRVAIVQFPKGEQGPVHAARGWVNGKFLKLLGR